MDSYNSLPINPRRFINLSIGSILEWYDFSIYGIFALQISKAFFPQYSTSSALLLTLLTFAAGFMARPLGALIFGYIGDTKGKQYAVNISVFCMAISTILIGLLPEYNNCGAFASLGLMLLRLIQGLSTGGQFSGIITIISDNNKQTPLYIGLSNAIVLIGMLIATVTGYLISVIMAEFPQYVNLSWRIPFLLSGFIFIIYILTRTKGVKYSELSQNQNKYALIISVILQQPKELIYTTILAILYGILYYTFFAYFITYMQLHLSVGMSKSFILMSIVLLFAILIFSIFGLIARNFLSRLKKAEFITLCSFIPVIMLLINHNIWLSIIMFFLLLANFCMIIVLCNTIFADIFNFKYKMTACAFSYNVGVAISGIAPVIAEFLAQHFTLGLQWMICVIFLGIFFITRIIINTDGYKKYLSTGQA